MLAKKNRLILPLKFNKLPKSTRRIRTKIVSLFIIPHERKEKETRKTRFTVTVSKRLDKRATRRNRTRRLISESIHHFLPKTKPGYDVIVIAQKIFWKEKLFKVRPKVEEALKKAGLLESGGTFK